MRRPSTSAFPSAPGLRFRSPAVRCSIPTFIDITHGRCNDLVVLDQLAFEAGAFYVMDRGYLHFQRLFRLSQSGAFFVTRADKNTQYRRQYSRPVDSQTGLRSDQTIRLIGTTSQHTYPAALRCVRYQDASTEIGRACVGKECRSRWSPYH